MLESDADVRVPYHIQRIAGWIGSDTNWLFGILARNKWQPALSSFIALLDQRYHSLPTGNLSEAD
jgi:hypothetical protein